MPMIFERSPDTDAVIRVLRGVNNEISYHELARQSGLTFVRAKDVLASARRTLRHDGILFGIIRAEGLRRMGALDKGVKAPAEWMKRVSRGTKKRLQDSETITDNEFQELRPADQALTSITRVRLHTITQQARMTPPTAPKQSAQLPLPNVVAVIAARKKA